MTRPELHALVDIVMDARERTGEDLQICIKKNLDFWHHGTDCMVIINLWQQNYPTFSDFTQAVKGYIKTLEG